MSLSIKLNAKHLYGSGIASIETCWRNFRSCRNAHLLPKNDGSSLLFEKCYSDSFVFEAWTWPCRDRFSQFVPKSYWFQTWTDPCSFACKFHQRCRPFVTFFKTRKAQKPTWNGQKRSCCIWSMVRSVCKITFALFLCSNGLSYPTLGQFTFKRF